MFYVGRLHDFIRGGNCIGLILLNGCFQIQVMVTVWRLTQTFVHEYFHLCLSKVFCTRQRLLNLRCDHILVDYILQRVIAILKHAMQFQRYNNVSVINVVFLHPTFCALIVCILIVFIVRCQS